MVWIKLPWASKCPICRSSGREDSRRPEDRINTRILNSGSQVQLKKNEGSRNHGFKEPCVYVGFWAPTRSPARGFDMGPSACQGSLFAGVRW